MLAENAVQLDEETQKSRLKTSSNYGISKLSPASQSNHCNLKKERAQLACEISKSTGRSIICPDIAYFMHHICITGVTLDDQTNEMSNLISTIDSSATGTAILQDIYKEAEQSGEGRGEVLKEIWRESQDRALFFRDQKLNSKAFKILATTVDISIHWTVGTGSKGNRWSLISYRIG